MLETKEKRRIWGHATFSARYGKPEMSEDKKIGMWNRVPLTLRAIVTVVRIELGTINSISVLQ